jgi:hypothetical protein
MPETTVSEQQIVEALHRVPATRWDDVLRFLGTLQIPPQPAVDIPSLAATTWTAAELQRWPSETQEAILRQQAAHLIERYQLDPHAGEAMTWWTARELGQLSGIQQGIILEASAAVAEDEYLSNLELTAFDTFGKNT